MFWREFADQRGWVGFGFLAGILEPIFHIAVVTFWHVAIRMMPIYGTSKILFIATGLYPIFMFIHLSSQFNVAVGSTKSEVHRYPVEKALDYILMRVMMKFIVYVVVGIILYSGIAILFAPEAIPDDPASACLGLLAFALIGLGVGLCNAVLGRIFYLWHMIYVPLSRALILFSGILYVPSFLPVYLRRYMKWNPLLQAVEQFRHGFYPHYPRAVYMGWFLWTFVLCSVVLGFCVERLFRRKLQES